MSANISQSCWCCSWGFTAFAIVLIAHVLPATKQDRAEVSGTSEKAGTWRLRSVNQGQRPSTQAVPGARSPAKKGWPESSDPCMDPQGRWRGYPPSSTPITNCWHWLARRPISLGKPESVSLISPTNTAHSHYQTTSGPAASSALVSELAGRSIEAWHSTRGNAGTAKNRFNKSRRILPQLIFRDGATTGTGPIL